MTFSNINPWLRIVIVILLPVLIVAILGWANLQFVRQNPGGNDFLVYYTGTRALLFEGQSPYSEVVADRIQTATYGRTAREGEHELRFVYPLYSTLFFTPFAVMSNFTLSRAVWMTILEVFLLLSAYINLQLTEWDPPWGLKVLYFLFAVVWYHAVRGVINGNAVILLAFLISFLLLSIKEGWDRWAGVLLAFATIKPHVVILFVILIWIWALSAGRGRILIWFSGTMIVLVGGSVALIPNWMIQNLWEMLRFPDYNPILTLGGLVGSWLPGIETQMRWLITFLVGGILLIEWWSIRGKSVSHFLWTAGLTLTAGQWIGIPTDPGNFIIMYPALVLVLSVWQKRWKTYGSALAAAALVALFLGLWSLFLITLQDGYQPIQSPVMFLPLPAFLLIALYWVRFWVIHPARQILK